MATSITYDKRDNKNLKFAKVWSKVFPDLFKLPEFTLKKQNFDTHVLEGRPLANLKGYQPK